MAEAALRVFGGIGVNFPHVLAEGAVEPDEGSLGLVWHALDARPLAGGATRRQARRSGNIAHIVKCRGRSGSSQMKEIGGWCLDTASKRRVARSVLIAKRLARRSRLSGEQGIAPLNR